MEDRPAIKTVSLPKASSLRILLMCNETMRKRCQCLASLLQSAGQGRGRRLLAVRLKCVTYAEDDGGVFSLSAKTDRLLADSDLTLCMLRVSRVQPGAWRQLVDMLAARQARFRIDEASVDKESGGREKSQSRVMLIQCCGPAYALDEPSESALNTDPSLVDQRLRAWITGHSGCQLEDLACVSVDNSSAGKALHHRLFGKRYTVQVEFAAYSSASERPRRHSLYRLTDGREAANGGCSPGAVVKRCHSVDDQLDYSGLEDFSCFNNNDGESSVEHLKQPLFHLDFFRPAPVAVTLVVTASRSCSVEAELCLNNLSSRGHRAVSIDTFSASWLSKGQQKQQKQQHQQQQQRRASILRLLLTGGRRRNDQLTHVLTQLTPESAGGAIFLVFCRGHRSRLLSELLRCAAQPAPKLTAPPLAAFAVIVGPVSEAECQQLRQLGSCEGQLRCQLDVICCPEGLAGQRILTCLMPGLSTMMRQLEVTAAAAGRLYKSKLV